MQHRPACGDQRVEPPPVTAELARLAVPGAVVLDRHPVLRERQVDPGDEPAVLVTDGVLRNGRETGQGEHHP